MADTPPLVAGFIDRLGDRVRLFDRGKPVEALRLRPELTASPLFEPAVRRRIEQLAGFEHQNFSKVLHVGRLAPPDGRLVVVSEAFDGWRLSEVLEAADVLRLPMHSRAILFLLRQLFGAVSSLHDVGLGVSHGALGTERLVVTSSHRLVVLESVFGGALRRLPQTSPDRLWLELRLAVADGEAQPFGRLTDLRQIGVIALSLALGRQLRRDEPPSRLASVIRELPRIRSERGADPFAPALLDWLAHLLSRSGDEASWSLAEAERELTRIVRSEADLAFEPTGLELLLEQVDEYDAADVEPPSELVPVRPCESVPAAAPSDEHGEAPRKVAAEDGAKTLSQPDNGGDQQEGVASVKTAAASCPTVESEAVDVEPPRLPSPSVSECAVPVAPAPAPAWSPAKRAVLAPIAVPEELLSPQATLRSTIADVGVPPAAAAQEPAETLSSIDRRHREASSSAARSRPMFGVDPESDAPQVARLSGRKRVGLLVGLGAAAMVIIAAGGYPLLRAKPADAAAMSAAKPSEPVKAADTSTAPPLTAPGPVAADVPAAPSPPPVAAPAEPPNGLVEIVSSIPLNVSESGRPIGTSGQPIRLPVGRHTLEIAREDFGYRTTHVVNVAVGRREQVRPSLPSGQANLNATPWAEVWIDGRNLGETPLGNVQLTIGPHEVTFRHPDFGEQTRTLVVTTNAVARLSVDLRR